MQVTIRKDTCIGCGMCAALAPQLFSIDSGAIELVKPTDSWTQEDIQAAKEAQAACPNGVIQLTE